MPTIAEYLEDWLWRREMRAWFYGLLVGLLLGGSAGYAVGKVL